MSQPIIKLLLLAAIALVALFALRGSTKAVHRILWRAYVVGILLAGAATVLFPGMSRGLADHGWRRPRHGPVAYILVITFLFVSVILFRRLDALERRYVGLARALAIQQASSDALQEPVATTAAETDVAE